MRQYQRNNSAASYACHAKPLQSDTMKHQGEYVAEALLSFALAAARHRELLQKPLSAEQVQVLVPAGRISCSKVAAVPTTFVPPLFLRGLSVQQPLKRLRMSCIPQLYQSEPKQRPS